MEGIERLVTEAEDRLVVIVSETIVRRGRSGSAGGADHAALITSVR